MKSHRSRIILAVACAIGIFGGVAYGNTLRIVSYNIDCSDQSSDDNITGPAHSLPTVVQAIGLHHIGTNAQPMDLMNCEELNSTTLSNFCVALNNIYGAGAYTYDTTTDTNTGGGPDGLIYNTHTIQVVSARALRDGTLYCSSRTEPTWRPIRLAAGRTGSRARRCCIRFARSGTGRRTIFTCT